MSTVVSSFKQSFSIIKKDKIVALLGAIPITLGALIYYFVGSWFYNSMLASGKAFIDSNISEGTLGGILYYVLYFLIFLVLYFLINWTFVLLVSIIASPFNDLLSARVEKLHRGGELPSVQDSFKQMLGRILKTIFTELKKISLILILTIMAALLSLTQLLAPIGLALSGLLLAVQFLDYSWSRHELTFGDCVNEVKSNFINYLIAGILSAFLMTIPLVNLLVLPFAVVYFTILRIEGKNIENRLEAP